MNDKKQPLAIALRYEQGTRDIAPKVVAKGSGLVAEAIITRAGTAAFHPRIERAGVVADASRT